MPEHSELTFPHTVNYLRRKMASLHALYDTSEREFGANRDEERRAIALILDPLVEVEVISKEIMDELLTILEYGS